MSIRLIFILIIGITLGGCATTDDVNLAKSAEGSWSAELHFPLSEELTMAQDIRWTFADIDKNRGSLVEVRQISFAQKRDEAIVEYYLTSQINGWFDVYDGDLYLHYSTPTLVVNVDSLNVVPRTDVPAEMAEGIAKYNAHYRQQLANDMRETLHEGLSEDFERYVVDGAAYLDLSVAADSLFCTATDLGRIGFIRK